MPPRSLYSLMCFAAAGAWPAVFSAARHALLSPYERALTTSFCGDSAQSAFEVAGHCATCWIGSAALLALGLTALARRKRARVRV